MARILERVEAHYEVQELSGGKVYKWCPQCALVECGFGERVTVTASMKACSRGDDHGEATRELGSLGPQALETRLALLEESYEWKAA